MSRAAGPATRRTPRARAVELAGRATAALWPAVPGILLIAATLAIVACTNGGTGPA